MRKRFLKVGTLSLVLGLALISLSFMEGFSADSISETLSNGLLVVRIGVIAGIVAVVIAVGCFITATSAE